MIFSPAALVVREVFDLDASLAVAPLGVAVTLGQGYLIVRSRERITVDGGRSIMATEPSLSADEEPKSNEGSRFLGPGSASDSASHSSLSGESQSDSGQEEPYIDSDHSGSGSPSYLSGVDETPLPTTKTTLPIAITVIQSAHSTGVEKPAVWRPRGIRGWRKGPY